MIKKMTTINLSTSQIYQKKKSGRTSKNKLDAGWKASLPKGIKNYSDNPLAPEFMPWEKKLLLAHMQERIKYKMYKKYIIISFFIIAQHYSSADKLKNVLFIMIDDLKPMIGAYGYSDVVTPNIDRLAEKGMVFLNAHCQQALCGPSRVSMLTGMYPDSIGIYGMGNNKYKMRICIQIFSRYHNISKILVITPLELERSLIHVMWKMTGMGHKMQFHGLLFLVKIHIIQIQVARFLVVVITIILN